MSESQVCFFFGGFLLCWEILGVFALLGQAADWQYDDRFWMVLSFPVLVVLSPLMLLWMLLVHPWQNVRKPVAPDVWEREKDGFAKLRLGKRFYICFDIRAKKLWNIIFFVLIDKGDS